MDFNEKKTEGRKLVVLDLNQKIVFLVDRWKSSSGPCFKVAPLNPNEAVSVHASSVDHRKRGFCESFITATKNVPQLEALFPCISPHGIFCKQDYNRELDTSVPQ